MAAAFAEQLCELKVDGLVDRRRPDRLRHRVIYRLTPHGQTVLPVVEGV